MAEPTVTHQPEEHRFVVTLDGELAGTAVYHDRNGRRIFVHTEIGDDFGGRGLGSTLVEQALSTTRQDGLAVVPLCPFVAGWLERHPEHDDLVDHQLLEALNGA